MTPFGFSCTYTTSSTDLGVVTGSKNTGGAAKLDINSVTISRTGDSAPCGTSAIWKGTYVVNRPSYLDID